MNQLIEKLGKAFAAWLVLRGLDSRSSVNLRLYRRDGLWQASFDDHTVEPPQATPEEAVRVLMRDFVAKARTLKQVEDERAKRIADAVKDLDEVDR